MTLGSPYNFDRWPLRPFRPFAVGSPPTPAAFGPRVLCLIRPRERRDPSEGEREREGERVKRVNDRKVVRVGRICVTKTLRAFYASIAIDSRYSSTAATLDYAKSIYTQRAT